MWVCSNLIWCLAESVSRQDEANPTCTLWLATQVGKVGPSCPLGISRAGSARKSIFLVNKQLTKLVWSRWLDIGLFLFCIFIDLGLVSGNKNAKKKLVNIQLPLYLPHAWSITHKNFWIKQILQGIENVLAERCPNCRLPCCEVKKLFPEDQPVTAYEPYGEGGPKVDLLSSISLLNR